MVGGCGIDRTRSGNRETGGWGDGGWRDGGGYDDIVVGIVIFVGHGEGLGEGGVDGFAPELEVPVGPGAIVLVGFGVLDNDGPGAKARFSPSVFGTEVRWLPNKIQIWKE